MPGRDTPLIKDHYYHIFNRAITSLKLFNTDSDYRHAKETISFYRFSKLSHRFSYYNRLSDVKKEDILKRLDPQQLVQIICFCLMPNHFHFLLKPMTDNGIQKFISNFCNSYTRYFNTKRNRHGPIFQGTFKSVLVENSEQLTHLSRYIHLNPYSSGLVSQINDLAFYPYSSFSDIINPSSNTFCHYEDLLSLFSGREEYKRFVIEHSDYQRQLESIKHLLIDP